MKKILTGIFTTSMCLACLSACGKNDVKYDVEGAADFLDSIYVEQIVDGRVDYDVLNSISFQGGNYTVEWSVDVTDGVKLVKGDKSTKVDVNEASDKDIDYVLTAKVSDPKGNSAEVKFYATLLKAKALIPVEITAKPVEGQAYKLYVYNNDSKTDCYFAGGYQATFYLNSVEDYEDEACVDIFVEYVEGSDTLFNMYFEHSLDGKQYVGIRENWNTKKGYWAYNPVIASEPVSQFEYSETHKTIITTVPACSEDKEDAEQDTTKTIYWGNSGSTYTSIGGVEIEDFGKEGYVANLVTMESAKDVPVADKIAFEKDALQLDDSYTGAQEVSVLTNGKRYPDVQITWAVQGDNVAYADGKLTITAPSAQTTVKVTATLAIGETKDTKEFTLTLKPAIVVPEAGSTLTISEAVALGEKFEKDTYTEGRYYVTGVVSNVANTTYGNLYIKDADGNELYVYGLADEDGNRYDAMATKPVVGDTITVYGSIGKYNSAQMKNATMTAYTAGDGTVPGTPTLTTPEEIVNALYALTNGQSLTGPFTVTGKITALDSYSNPTIVVEGLEDKPIYCYRLVVDSNVGDTITVTAGSMKNYNGTYEFMDCTLVTDGGEEGGDVTPPAGGDTPTEIATLTIPEANELGATKAHNTYTSEKYYVSGIVTSIYNTQYGNMYIVDENGNQLNVYGTYNADGSVAFSSMEVKPQVGEVVKLLTALGSYSNAPQAKDAWIVEISTATDAQKIAIEKAALSVAESVNGARELELDVAGSLYSDVAIAWEVTAGVEIATYANGILAITNPEADTTVTVKAILSVGEASVEVSYNIAVAHKEAVSGEETLATFTFGANGSAAHVDGSDLGASKTYSENGYDLELTSMSKVYGPAYDATGNSCIKLGTSSKTATLSFTVADDVDKVIINIAGYKAATSTNLTINGTSYSVKTASNNGEYTAIEIDTSTTKTITLTTVTYRAMIDSIVFIGIN
ncbi:MAG: hypothetical protein IKA20_03785 [Clostridia bacterium]|nr:hypothetical protein [Clostridia bacterium]